MRSGPGAADGNGARHAGPAPARSDQVSQGARAPALADFVFLVRGAGQLFATAPETAGDSPKRSTERLLEIVPGDPRRDYGIRRGRPTGLPNTGWSTT